LSHVLLAAVVTSVALRVFLLPVVPADFWWALATGRLIEETGRIPTADVFSYTFPGAPWFDQPWLSQSLIYGAHVLGGVPLVLLAALAAVTTAFLLLYRLGVRITGASAATAAFLLLTLPASSPAWSVRSRVFALPLFVAFVIVLHGWRTGRDGGRLWLLPLVMAVWANAHGSFVLGGVLVAVTLAGMGLERLLARSVGWTARGPRMRALVFWGGVTALAVLANPRGVAVFDYVRGVVGNPVVQGLILEWQRPSPVTFIGGVFYLYAVGLLAVVWTSRRRPDAVEILTGVVFFGLGLSALRHTAWFVLATTPTFLASAAETRLGSWITAWPEPSPAAARALVATFAVLVLASSPWVKPSLPWPEAVRPVLDAETPVAAVAAVRADPQAPHRLFHSETYGSYLMWAAPERRVFIDTRVEVYPADHWQTYMELTGGRRASEVLEDWQVDGLLLDQRRQWRLVGWARERPDWVVRYEDERSVYFVRSPGI
jgi:hypothetical protein